MAKEVAILGVGMHPWGKWGKNFVEYGIKACNDALDDAGLEWQDIEVVAGAETVRNGYAGYVAGATFAEALGWSGARVSTSYAACASGSQAINNARAMILADMADVILVVGADTTPKGFLAPNAGERWTDPDWLRFRLMGCTNPTYFALYARRRMDLYGATEEDFAAIKVKNARHGMANPNARYHKEFTLEQVLESPMVADPLRLFEICATSDGAAAVVLMSAEKAVELGIKPRMRWHTRAVSGVEPAIMGIGPVPAVRKALKKAGMSIDDIGLIELNEAFASQALYCMRELNMSLDNTNVNGSGISLGHPVGATGAIMTVKLMEEMESRGDEVGLVTMCVGGGQGVATIFQRTE